MRSLPDTNLALLFAESCCPETGATCQDELDKEKLKSLPIDFQDKIDAKGIQIKFHHNIRVFKCFYAEREKSREEICAALVKDEAPREDFEQINDIEDEKTAALLGCSSSFPILSHSRVLIHILTLLALLPNIALY